MPWAEARSQEDGEAVDVLYLSEELFEHFLSRAGRFGRMMRRGMC
jgi:hypothetical protein